MLIFPTTRRALSGHFLAFVRARQQSLALKAHIQQRQLCGSGLETEAHVGGRAQTGVSTATRGRAISQEKSSTSKQRRSLKEREKSMCCGMRWTGENAKWVF